MQIIIALVLIFNTLIFAETNNGTGEVDNYSSMLKALEKNLSDEADVREKIEKTNDEILETGKQLLKTLNRFKAPNLVLEDDRGNKTIVSINEDTKQIVIQKLDNKSLFPKDETIDTSTEIGKVAPKSLNSIVKFISVFLYVLSSGYLLALAVMNALNRGYTIFIIDFVLWLFITGLMARILGFL